jgi:hypothetical protein
MSDAHVSMQLIPINVSKYSNDNLEVLNDSTELIIWSRLVNTMTSDHLLNSLVLSLNENLIQLSKLASSSLYK